MQKKLNIKYNIPTIKIFLSIFGLDLEEKQDVNTNDILNIYMDGTEVGKIEFGDEIIINSLSIYGGLKCKTNYASAFTLTDIESLEKIGDIGLFASWNNNFNFNLDFFNGSVLSGKLFFDVKIDNEFGNRISPNFKLNYRDNEKEYDIEINKSGNPFKFVEKRASSEEKIIYRLFDTISVGSYIYHSRTGMFTDNSNNYKEVSFISNSSEDKNIHTAVVHKEFNNNCIVHNYKEFNRVSDDETAIEEVINKADFMNLIDPSVKERISSLIEEFTIEGESFLEKILLYGFNHYSNEEIYSLFGINKNDVNLEELYFEDNGIKSHVRKFLIFH